MHRRWLLIFACVLYGCGADDGFYPLAGDEQWEYQVEVENFTGKSRTRQLVTARGTGNLENHAVSLHEYGNGELRYYAATSTGILRLATRKPFSIKLKKDEPPVFVLKKPYAIGTAWVATSTLVAIQAKTYEPADQITPGTAKVPVTYRIAALDETVSVPAGTFTGCMRIESSGSVSIRVDRGNHFGTVSIAHTEWYAPAAGLIKSERVESSTSQYLQDGYFKQELIRLIN